jgi:hypothetical protein
MQLFLHTPVKIRIIDDEQEFACEPAAFSALEPAYPGLTEGQTYRYWTPEYSYVEGVTMVSPDPVNCLPFIQKVSVYQQQLATIYIHVTLAKSTLCVNQIPADSIQVTAAFKPSVDPESPTLPVTHEWFIKLRHEDGWAFDSFRAVFVDGACALTYDYKEGLPLGNWALLESDFVPVTVGGQTYQVKLAQPVSFTMYREL